VEQQRPLDDARGREVESPRDVFLSRPVLAVIGALALAALAEWIPAFARLRVFSARPEAVQPAAKPASSVAMGEAELQQETQGHGDGLDAAPARTPKRAALIGTSTDPVPNDLVDRAPQVELVAADGALAGFFGALERTRRKEAGAVTRITHFGDSVVASDYVSGTLRRRFQERFGDAGHGFTLIANAWPAYFHNDIERYATAGWKVSRVVGPLAEDGLYGLGCVSFRAEKNVLARFSTPKKGEFGRQVSRFSVYYLASPGGGAFQISVDGAPHTMVDTHAEATTSKVQLVQVPDGPHEFEVYTKRGASRLFGVTLERDGPGVVLDAIGIQGARIRFLDKQDDAHWAEQLALRSPQLLIYEFGANESADGLMYPMPEYHRTMKEVLAQGRRALPNSSCLVIGAMDRATKTGSELTSLSIISHLIEEQRKAALEVGCAFFDTYRAMGGNGSMPKWVRRGLGQADLTHPSAEGSDLIGTWIFRALMQRYGEFLGKAGVAGASPSARTATSSPSAR
jgi:hypothetical protein